MKRLEAAKFMVADALARLALRFRALERLLARGAHSLVLRRHLRLGAIALGYPRVLLRREIRTAKFQQYSFLVNVGEAMGVEPYFFGYSGTVWFVGSLLQPGDIFVDAGANVGAYTFLAASIVGARGRVYAFEPNPEFAYLLERSVELNSFQQIVTVDKRALWSSSGERREFFLSVEPSNSGTSSLINHGLFVSRDCTIVVETVRLDDYMDSAGIKRVRVLKIDVERAEDFLLEGAARALMNQLIDFVIIELISNTRTQQFLIEAGYRGYLLNEHRFELLQLADVPSGTFGNYLFIRSDLELPPFATSVAR